MPGIDIAEPERTETSNGSSPPPKRLPVLRSSAAMCVLTASIAPSGRAAFRVREAGEAGLGRDDEAGRYVQPDPGHLAEVGALAAEQHLVAAVTFLERVHPLLLAVCHD